MTESYGSRGEAADHLRRADTRWTEAVRTFHAYPDRLRRLAEAADTQRKAFMFADLCNITWKPRENTDNLRLAPELEKPNRIGPPKLWGAFDRALQQFGDALAGDSLLAIAQAFGAMSQAAGAIADALESTDTAASTG